MEVNIFGVIWYFRGTSNLIPKKIRHVQNRVSQIQDYMFGFTQHWRNAAVHVDKDTKCREHDLAISFKDVLTKAPKLA
jgi:hypothetical protein